MLAFHGTTREHAINILSNGAKNIATWNCSDDAYLYLWCPNVLVKYKECDKEDANAAAIQRAFEAAQITAAMSENMQRELIVLCFDFPKKLVELDQSCENVELSRCVCLEDYTKYYKTAYVAKHNPRLDAFVISGLLENRYINLYAIDEDLLQAAKTLRDNWIDSLLEFDYTEKDIIKDISK